MVVENSETNSPRYYPTYDANGNVSEYLDSTGDVVAHYEYSPFGDLTAATGAKSAEFAHRFSTKYLDTETNLYYYGRRYCSPELGRWINRDPIKEEGGTNLAAFLGNDPLSKQDPIGLSPRPDPRYDDADNHPFASYTVAQFKMRALTRLAAQCPASRATTSKCCTKMRCMREAAALARAYVDRVLHIGYGISGNWGGWVWKYRYHRSTAWAEVDEISAGDPRGAARMKRQIARHARTWNFGRKPPGLRCDEWTSGVLPQLEAAIRPVGRSYTCFYVSQNKNADRHSYVVVRYVGDMPARASDYGDNPRSRPVARFDPWKSSWPMTYAP